jgi:hypothetical protein
MPADVFLLITSRQKHRVWFLSKETRRGTPGGPVGKSGRRLTKSAHTVKKNMHEKKKSGAERDKMEILRDQVLGT